MKTKNIFYAAVLLAGMAMGSTRVDAQQVTPPMTLGVSLTDSVAPKFTIDVQHPAGQRVKVEVYSPVHGYVLANTYERGSFRQQLDFTRAEDGVYTLTVNDGKTAIRKDILVQTRDMIVRASRVAGQ